MTFRFEPMPNRLATYSVWSATAGLIGYLRWLENGDYVARTRGSATDAADIKKFTSQNVAAAWLVAAASKVRAPISRGRGRRAA